MAKFFFQNMRFQPGKLFRWVLLRTLNPLVTNSSSISLLVYSFTCIQSSQMRGRCVRFQVLLRSVDFGRGFTRSVTARPFMNCTTRSYDVALTVLRYSLPPRGNSSWSR